MPPFEEYFGDDSESSDRSSDESTSSSSYDSTERINRNAAIRVKTESNSIFQGIAESEDPPEITMFELLSKVEVKEALLLPTPPEVPRMRGDFGAPKNQKRQPVVPGASLSTTLSLEDLWRDFNFSYDVEYLVPTPDQRADNPPEGYFTCIEGHFRDALLWFPIPSLIWRFLHKYKICISQLPPGSIRHLVCILVRSYECGISIRLADLMRLLEVRKDKEELSCRLQPGNGCRVLEEFSYRNRYWASYFFFVKIDDASVDGSLDLVRTTWGKRGIPRLP